MARSFCGQALRRLREARDLRPEGLAVLVDRSSSTINHYELCVATPPAEILAALADALHCATDELLIVCAFARAKATTHARASGRCEHLRRAQTHAQTGAAA